MDILKKYPNPLTVEITHENNEMTDKRPLHIAFLLHNLWLLVLKLVVATMVAFIFIHQISYLQALDTFGNIVKDHLVSFGVSQQMHVERFAVTPCNYYL